VRGKQILGAYPDLSSTSRYNIDARGRMVPTLPYDAMWTGVAQWMGVTDEDGISYMLPERKNFQKCSMFTDSQLFKSGTTPAYPCT
jgi:cullin-associated NEDD8-dissociated protein 1